MDNRREFMTRALGAAGLAVSGLAGADVARAQAARPVTLAWPNDVPNWDPISAGTPVSRPIHKCVFDSPLDVAPDLSFAPSVVASYRWLDREGRQLELTIRDGVTFHNGDALTSEDFRFTFDERPKAEPTLALAGVWGKVVEKVTTPSPRTAVFHFAEPFVTAPQLMTEIPSYVIPRRYFEQVGRTGFMQKPVGSGPYRLVEYQRDSRIVLEAYDKFWGGPVPIKQLVFQVIKDTSTRIAAIWSGQVDFAHSLPVREVVRLGNHPNLVSQMHPTTLVVLINMVNKGVFRDRNLRLAMHHAIDKETLSKTLFNGKASPLSTWSGEGMVAYDPNFKFPYSPEKARALLAQSGYGPEKPAKIEFLSTNGVFPSDFDLARALVQMWKRVGIEAELGVIEIAKYFEMARNDKLEAPVLYSWGNATGDPVIYSGYILDPKKRFSVWKSDDISAKLDPLLTEVDYEKRIAGYRAFDAWAVEQGYALPLLQGPATVVHTKRIGYVPFRNGWERPHRWAVSG
jgi:peptide/nickel transport system substrate-binding protein